MLKIKANRRREWARLFLKISIFCGLLYVLFGVLFGVARCAGELDGDLALYCRVCNDYSDSDMIVMKDGSVVGYGEMNGGLVAGKMIARLSVRGFNDARSE